MKAAEQSWRDGNPDLRSRKVEEAFKLDPGNPFWRGLTPPVAPYLRGTRAEVMSLWNRAGESPPESQHLLAQARELAKSLKSDELIAKTDFRSGLNLIGEGQIAAAGDVFENVVERARKVGDPNLLASSLVTLSVTRMQLDRHDEAIAECLEAAKLVERAPNAGTSARLENNLGWSYLQLGDEQQAIQHLTRSAALYNELGSDARGDEVKLLQNLAAYHVRLGHYAEAEKALNRANEAAVSLPDDRRAPVLADMAEVHAMNHEPDLARESILKAQSFGKFDGIIRSHNDAHIRFVQAMIDEARNDPKAEAGYREVANATVAWSSMRLEAALKRARWLVRNSRNDEAEAQYQSAEDLLEGMRARLKQDESKLSFFADAAAVYNEYVEFLFDRGKKEKALLVADRSRAKLLSDYQKEKTGLEPLNIVNLQARLKTVGGIALFYWIGGRHSYLWIIGASSFEPVRLSAEPEGIRRLSRTYFEAVSTRAGLTPDALKAGDRLRDVLLSPAKNYLTRDRRVYLVLDGELGLINPESLPGTHGGWWIDEVIASVVPSLTLLAGSHRNAKPGAKLLLGMGDPLESAGFEKLTYASEELREIGRLFPPGQARFITGRAATPAAYRDAHPIDFQMIQFTAHGKAEAGNPLDSSVVLSPDPRTGVSKLYAREIVGIRIEARLVTISACRSAVSRTYRGEGSVGLAWAFLRAGAGQVVAGLWDVNDEATRDLMARFYEGMQNRRLPPAVALRDAKRELIKFYKNPYYWAPFEIFAGHIEP